jgi:hypothetical protein
MNDSEKFESERIGALWMRKSKKGLEYLTGEVNGERLVAFPATNKRRMNSPDYQVFKNKDKETTAAKEKDEKEAPKQKDEKEGASKNDENDLPF